MRPARVLVAVSLAVVALAGCGDSDDSVTAEQSDHNTSQSVDTEHASTEMGGSLPDNTAGPVDDYGCSDMVSLDEAAAIFGAPAEFDPSTSYEDEVLGHVVCGWQTVDDEEALQILSVLVAVDAPNDVIDPSAYAAAEPLDIGDESFIDETNGVTVGFASGDTAVLTTWFSFEIGGEISAEERGAVIELARTIESRI